MGGSPVAVHIRSTDSLKTTGDTGSGCIVIRLGGSVGTVRDNYLDLSCMIINLPLHFMHSLVPRPTPVLQFFAALPHPCIIVNETEEQKKRGRPGNEATLCIRSSEELLMTVDQKTNCTGNLPAAIGLWSLNQPACSHQPTDIGKHALINHSSADLLSHHTNVCYQILMSTCTITES